MMGLRYWLVVVAGVVVWFGLCAYLTVANGSGVCAP